MRNLMRRTLAIGASAGFIIVTGLMPVLAADPVGEWKVSDGTALVRIADCNGSMWGAVSWEQTPALDNDNPDASKRGRPVLGTAVLLDMKKKRDEQQWEGQVYNAKNGKLYDSKMKLLGPDQLEVKGCVLGILCGGDTWSRVETPALVALATNAPKKGSKTAGAKSSRPTDSVGDVCQLPEVAGSVSR